MLLNTIDDGHYYKSDSRFDKVNAPSVIDSMVNLTQEYVSLLSQKAQATDQQIAVSPIQPMLREIFWADDHIACMDGKCAQGAHSRIKDDRV